MDAMMQTATVCDPLLTRDEVTLSTYFSWRFSSTISTALSLSFFLWVTWVIILSILAGAQLRGVVFGVGCHRIDHCMHFHFICIVVKDTKASKNPATLR